MSVDYCYTSPLVTFCAEIDLTVYTMGSVFAVGLAVGLIMGCLIAAVRADR